MQLRLSILFRFIPNLLAWIGFVALSACSSQPSEKTQSHDELLAVYLSNTEAVSVDIVFERGHNSHRIHAAHREMGPEIQKIGRAHV